MFAYSRDDESSDEQPKDGNQDKEEPLYYWNELTPIPGTESYARWQTDILDRTVDASSGAEPLESE